MNENKAHWENVYETKGPEQVSWTQALPQTSLDFIHSFNLPKTAAIIDIGGGDSNLADHLLNEGFVNITVLDISAAAIEKAKARLGDKAEKVKWIVSDINDFNPATTYDVWHDRAAFHFLTNTEQIANYVSLVSKVVTGYLVMATFSENGPKKCSGLDITQYNEEGLEATFTNGFKKIKCLTHDHTTPFNTVQNFTFCSFEKSK
jgi:2-polyprenyl-3-methyl-5-hydroxy-6-metoxy-1,4-benzoquinol methylase